MRSCAMPIGLREFGSKVGSRLRASAKDLVSIALTIVVRRWAKKEASLPDPTYMSAITDSTLRSGVGD
jgi:hypothetical protein